MTRLTLTVLALVALSSAPALAAPSSISFSGRLATASGPVDGAVTIGFLVYDRATGGTARWEDSAALTADDGLVFATLGRAGNPLDATVFTGEELFLEVVVQGETLSPRLPIHAAPYAVRSSAADSADRLGPLAPGDVQLRIAGSCSAGEAIRAIGADGTVTCEADDNTVFSAATGGGLSINAANQVSTDVTVQRRTAATNNMKCPSGQYMRQILQTGEATCLPAIACELVVGSTGATSTQTVSCPAGNIIMGGGCSTPGNTSIFDSFPQSTTSWFCRTSTGGSIQARAVCCDVSI